MPQERVNLWQEDLRCLRLFSVPEEILTLVFLSDLQRNTHVCETSKTQHKVCGV